MEAPRKAVGTGGPRQERTVSVRVVDEPAYLCASSGTTVCHADAVYGRAACVGLIPLPIELVKIIKGLVNGGARAGQLVGILHTLKVPTFKPT